MPISGGQVYFFARFCGHSLHWECGLKLIDLDKIHNLNKSLPSLGVWIETQTRIELGSSRTSLPSLGVWIETWNTGVGVGSNGSLPSLGVWIETRIHHRNALKTKVTPFIGSVD